MAAAIRRPGLRLALVHNTLGGFNTPNGAFALQNNITGSNNTAVGFGALINNTGTANIGVGLSAGDFVTSANNEFASAQASQAQM